ncbi:hypothetical protein [Ferrimonas marina]|uniref:Uncharacterized protein n=1 Tax=Ferrimonas marina TaxID=299255 RepID=A0A1M5TZH7_9GAMM|nr:hypothetical protein [Ferrimonas marina]SHH56235.1 hypothetical protein SAMN02745129_2345 [Ferrimonas marina]
MEWDFKASIKVDDPDTVALAQFLLASLTEKNLAVLQKPISIMLPIDGWRSKTIATLFSPVIVDRLTMLQKAIESGQCQSQTIPALNRQAQRHVVGAAMCELLNKGYRCRLLSLIQPDTVDA